MAHQAHNLPWNTLADNFKFVHANSRYHERTNLYPCFKPGQGKQLQHFAKVFSHVLEDFSRLERKQYTHPAEIIPPEWDELFVPEASAKRVAKTTGRNGTILRYTYDPPPPPEIQRRLTSVWINELNEHFYPSHDESLVDILEMFKTLVLYGDMEPLFRLTAHPDVNLSRVWNNPIEEGWSELKDTFLTAYICLNVLYLKPELWDPTSRAEKLATLRRSGDSKATPEDWDYRLTSSYQWMLVQAVTTRGHKDSRVCMLPHREFFGVEQHMYSPDMWRQQHDIYGVGPLSELAEEGRKNWYLPSTLDIPIVTNILGKKGLPAELAVQVLELADYSKPKRRLPIKDDPLHPQNHEELKKYLSYCWRMLGRVDMLLKANGGYIDWEFEVTEAIFRLWGVPYPKMSRVDESEWENRRVGAFVNNGTNCVMQRTFI